MQEPLKHFADRYFTQEKISTRSSHADVADVGLTSPDDADWLKYFHCAGAGATSLLWHEPPSYKGFHWPLRIPYDFRI